MIVTALIGNPTDHSVSPLLFKIYADEHRLEYSHIKCNVKNSDLEQVIRSFPYFGFSGANITLPYKSDVIQYLDSVEPEISKIGAVNTIVNNNGKLIGYNTDKYGAITTMEESLGKKICDQDNAVVFGSGGASRAVVFGLLEKGASVAVVYRKPESSKTISYLNDFSEQVQLLTSEDNILNTIKNSNIICNTTSVGMVPNSHVSIFPISYFEQTSKTIIQNQLFFDVVFNPGETKFLTDAKRYGAKTANGIDMMVYQGVKAFKLWTGKSVGNKSINKARKLLREVL